ncbi:MAG: ribonuclease T [Sphingobium sp.]|nr:ribonuclease T [Sphingobium sp.]
MLKGLIALAALAMPGAAFAQAAQCTIPQQIARPRPDLPDADQPRRVLPIGGYTLALTWSPQYCATASSAGFQCGGKNGRFGFTLHGLWPDGVGKDWPQYCWSTGLLPRKLIRDNLCATPSVQLIQHEWAKHGTCMTTRPERYFKRAQALYTAIRYPDMAALAERPSLTVGDFAKAFAAANRGIGADMMRVTVTQSGWLDEVWLCLDKRLGYVRCPAHQGGASDGTRLRIARPAR